MKGLWLNEPGWRSATNSDDGARQKDFVPERKDC